jgi:acyl-CoA synthetase (AMP-forming)/AMP-acid ligase II
VCAAVVGTATPDDVMAHARLHLAPYKRPKQVFVVGALPHTSTGKLQRGAVASELGLEG